jgi:hypothetical protein
MMKRQRGRGRKPGNPNSRNFESNGPDVKVRGNASHVYEKYLQLARDASSSGDRVMAENYYQHAEHYLRIVQASQPRREDGADGADAQDRSQQRQDRQGDDRSRDQERQPQTPRQNEPRASANGHGESPRQNDPDAGAGANQDPQGQRSRRGQRRPQAEAGADPLEVVEFEGSGAPQTPSDDDAAKPKKRVRTRRPRADKAAEDALKAAEENTGG